MHYKIGNHIIKSENAAKPPSQASSYLLDWIRNLSNVDSILDFGCGKLRYAGALATKCRRLILVDSDIQLNRNQLLGGTLTTVIHYAKRCWPHSRVLTLEELDRDPLKYDFILCANVLPVIPKKQVRSSVMRRLHTALRNSGFCLFVTQYRNSYFKQIVSSPNVESHLDGWILTTSKGSFYYGLLPPEKLERIVVTHGFAIDQSWEHEGSAYVIARAR